MMFGGTGVLCLLVAFSSYRSPIPTATNANGWRSTAEELQIQNANLQKEIRRLRMDILILKDKNDLLERRLENRW